MDKVYRKCDTAILLKVLLFETQYLWIKFIVNVIPLLEYMCINVDYIP